MCTGENPLSAQHPERFAMRKALAAKVDDRMACLFMNSHAVRELLVTPSMAKSDRMFARIVGAAAFK